MSGKESSLSHHSELRIVLVGKVGAGKTSVMSSILRSSAENQKPAPERLKNKVKIRGQTVVLVDTPGLCSAEQTDEEVMEKIKHCVSITDPGPHVFLFVLSCVDRFTAEEQDMVTIIKETFGDDVTRYTMVLFTFGDELKKKGKDIREFFEESSRLKSFVAECNGGHHVFDNRDEDPSQVAELLQEINAMVQRNGGECYTTDTIKAMEETGQCPGIRRRIALSVNGSAVAGAALGGVLSHFVGSSAAIPAGVAAGAAAGGLLGGVGVVIAEHMKAKTCTIQ